MRRHPTSPLARTTLSRTTLLGGILILLVGLALVALRGTPAEANASQEFKRYGFKWSLPEDWKFAKPAPDMERAGFVAKVECTMASIEVWLYTAPTDGLNVAERATEVKSNGAEGMGKMVQAKVVDSTLSGIKGKAVAMKIDADGSEGYFRTYVIAKGGNFYQMIMRCWHGAQFEELESLNAVRKGFRLLKGAGAEDKSDAFDEFGSADDEEDEDGDEEGDDAGDADEGNDPNWPSGGAKKEGRKISLPTHNLEWTLPKGPFQWTDAPAAETAKEGRFVVAQARVEREAKQEFEKNKKPSQGWLDLIIQEIPAGLKVNTWVKGGSATDNIKKWKLFDTINSSKTRTFEKKNIGNTKGAILKVEGKKDGRPVMMLLFTTTMRNEWYIFRAYFGGAGDVYKHMVKDIGAAIKGVHFIDTTELLRGPLIGAIPDFAWHRGKNKDKEKVYKGPGFSFKKPKGMQSVKVKDSMNRDIRFTGEMRNKEGDAYLYFEVRTIPLKVPRGQPMPKPENFVNKRAEAWSAGAGETASVGKKKGDLGKKGVFNGAKGLKYSFTGDLNGVPYVEEGYVVKHKQNLVFIKFQFGGEDGPKKLKKLKKLVTKGMKFNK